LRRLTRIAGLAVALAAIAAPAASAGQGGDPAATALNIIPTGQDGSLPPLEGATLQLDMYDGLTPLFDQVTSSDLTTYFKSEKFGVGPDGPVISEESPRPGVTIVRDRFRVPHVTADSYDLGVWAAGWIAAHDRPLLLEQTRFNARIAAIDAPGLSAINIISSLRTFIPSAQTEAEVAKQEQALVAAGPEGQAVLHDIDTFVQGINDYRASIGSSIEPWTRNDIFALNSLKSQFLGQGGGDEARRSQFLGGLIQRLGRKKGWSVFNDLRQFKNPENPTAVDGKFKYGHIPKNAKGSVVLDPGSFQPTPAAPNVTPQPRVVPEGEASNVLMIGRERSKTGRPLMVGGPQLGYFYPGLTYEIDMNAPGLRWRGATTVPFPGYVAIGRGVDFAMTLTSAGGDIIDQYVETLCNGSDEMYLYKGECLPMEHFEAGTLDGEPVSFLRTVHGPVVGYATVKGERVAISRKRSSYGKDVVDQLFFRRLSNGQVDSPKSYFKAASMTPQTFNSFYIDSRHIAEFTSGLFPIRPKNVDPGLPTIGTGEYEWTGFLGTKKHPQGVDPRDGTITNWNNGAAKGFGAADDEWGKNGSVGRVDLLDYNLRNLQRNGEWTLASVVAAMNAAATQDVRAIDTVPLLVRLLKGSQAPSPMAQQMLDVLVAWRKSGGSRLDRDLDGLIDHPGAAVMDRTWPQIANAAMAPVIGPQLEELRRLFSRWAAPPDGQFSGWYMYLDKDIRALLGKPVKAPFRNSYCGGGNKAACQQSIWTAIEAAGQELAAEQGTADPAAWRADATAERIRIVPGLLPNTIRYTNRPSGIQQLISFGGKR
jgi:acyl-homoserine lactone acylase PvdQ